MLGFKIILIIVINLKLTLQDCTQYIDYVACFLQSPNCVWSEGVSCVDGCSDVSNPEECELLEDCESISQCQEILVNCAEFNSRDECYQGSPMCYFDENYSCQMQSITPCKYLNDTECAKASDICQSGNICRRKTLNSCSDYDDHIEECDGFRGCRLEYEGCIDNPNLNNNSNQTLINSYKTTPYVMERIYNDCAINQDYMCQQNSNCYWVASSCKVTESEGSCIPFVTSCWTLNDATICHKMDQAKCIRNTNNCKWHQENQTCTTDQPCEEASISQCNQWVDSCIGGEYTECVTCEDDQNESCSPKGCEYVPGICFTKINKAKTLSTLILIIIILLNLISI